MNLTRLMVAVAVVGGGIGLAVPANAADAHALGTYTFEAEDGESATWTVSPCADPDDDHCVFVQSTGSGKRAPWAGNAYWTVGSWILFVNQPDAILCGDSSLPGLNNYSWDATALTGYTSINTVEGDCGAAAESVAIPFTLTKTGSGPIQYPNAPVYSAPDVAPPITAEAPASTGGAMPAEQDPSIVATPAQIPNLSDPLTEAIVAEPGFNAGGGGRR
jgi:hypothetical protein